MKMEHKCQSYNEDNDHPKEKGQKGKVVCEMWSERSNIRKNRIPMLYVLSSC